VCGRLQTAPFPALCGPPVHCAAGDSPALSHTLARTAASRCLQPAGKTPPTPSPQSRSPANLQLQCHFSDFSSTSTSTSTSTSASLPLCLSASASTRSPEHARHSLVLGRPPAACRRQPVRCQSPPQLATATTAKTHAGAPKPTASGAKTDPSWRRVVTGRARFFIPPCLAFRPSLGKPAPRRALAQAAELAMIHFGAQRAPVARFLSAHRPALMIGRSSGCCWASDWRSLGTGSAPITSGSRSMRAADTSGSAQQLRLQLPSGRRRN